MTTKNTNLNYAGEVRTIRSRKEIAKDIRKKLHSEFPMCKFSVTVRHYNSIDVRLMQAPFLPLKLGMTSGQLNHYHIDTDKDLTDEGKILMKRVYEIANAENWDDSDAQSDYFSVNYYLGLSVGRWDTPFVLKEV